jgi:hypothetical protein
MVDLLFYGCLVYFIRFGKLNNNETGYNKTKQTNKQSLPATGSDEIKSNQRNAYPDKETAENP